MLFLSEPFLQFFVSQHGNDRLSVGGQVGIRTGEQGCDQVIHLVGRQCFTRTDG